MSNTNELTGRELAEAAARAMGWKQWHYGPPGWFDPSDKMRDWGEPCFAWVEPMMAWLHERGVVHTASSSKATEARFLSIAGAMHFVPDDPYQWISGTDLREALERLVVAVAEREAKA